MAMSVIICMLRAVNLPGHNQIKMDALRGLCESMGLEGVRSYLQSGNVIFRTKEPSLERLAEKIHKGLERKFKISTDVILRTKAELKSAMDRNPFAERRGIEPSRLLVYFIARDPGREVRERVVAMKSEPEELHVSGRELYIYYPNGMARPKLSWSVLEKALETRGTGRNWNSVRQMFEMAEELGDP